MKQKTRVMFLTLIATTLLGLAMALLPLENHSAHAAKGGKGGKGGKVATVETARVDNLLIPDCNTLLISTSWANIPKVARVDIVLMQNDTQFVLAPDDGHPIGNETAIFTPNKSELLGYFGTSAFKVTETNFYNKRGKIITTFTTTSNPPLTGVIGPINADCNDAS